jgi:hypothetical protein
MTVFGRMSLTLQIDAFLSLEDLAQSGYRIIDHVVAPLLH